MTLRLEIWDNDSGFFLNLRDVLAILPPRAMKSKWIISPYLDGDEELIEVVTEGENILERFATSGERTTFARLQATADTVTQVIWGVFKGFDGQGGAEPWIILTAFDSTCWRVDTQDDRVRRRFERSFHDVREVSS